jgi:hypothetical protein
MADGMAEELGGLLSSPRKMAGRWGLGAVIFHVVSRQI